MVEAAAEGYLELLRLVDGGIFESVVVFGAKIVEKMQFYAEDDEGAPVRLGRELWFCFGKVNEDPLFVKRQDGAVWDFPT
ncbi:MAG: hypothetical protein QOF58_2910 [Pseudonocardiales bacterium]|jgi:hypothetical protein|nr:hypothetical protein [Pseudonocardiales bacterium]